MARLFISYSRSDADFARRLATDLKRLGADLWLDLDDIPAGEKWSSAIQEGLKQAEVMILILSPQSMQSNNVEDEWQYFIDKKRPIVPVLLVPTEIHFQLSRIQYVDFHTLNYDRALRRLHAELGRKGVVLQPLAPLPPGSKDDSGTSSAAVTTKVAPRRSLLVPFIAVVVLIALVGVGIFLVKGLGGSATPPITPTIAALAATVTNSVQPATTEAPTPAPTVPPTSVPTIAPTTAVVATNSPKGTKIAFSRNGDIWVMDSDGKNAHSLYANASTDEAVPAWSHSGDTIAFRSKAGSNSEIFTVDSEGAKLTRLTLTNNRDTTPDYSPDDKKIVYSTTFNEIADIAVMNADGSNPVKLTSNGGVMNYTPKWSPDGKRIAFSSNRTGKYEIWVMDSDGGNPTQLTRNGAANYAPAWSADGKYIAFESDLNGGGAGAFDIYVLQVDGAAQNPVNLTNSPGIADIDPAWSPDGLIAYASKKSGVYQIYVTNVNGQGSPTPLAVGSEPAWGQ